MENSNAAQPEFQHRPSTEQKSGNKRPKPFPTWGDLLAFLGIFLLCTLISGIIVIPLLRLSDSISQQAVTFVSYLVQFSLTIGLLLFYRRSRGGEGRLLKFSFKWFNAALILWGVLLVFMIGVVIEPLLDIFPDSYLEMLNQAVGRGGWAIVTTIIVAPIMEEILFRGIILESVRSRFGTMRSILISAAIFGIIHIIPQQVINAFFVGLVLGFIYVKTESIFSVMILHAINNALAYLQTVIFGDQLLSMKEMIGNHTVYYILYGISAAVCILAIVQIARHAAKDEKSRRAGAGTLPENNITPENNVDKR